MKTLENKTTQLPKEKGFITFADLAMSVINQPPQEGFSVSEMQLRLAMRSKLESANGKIKLEDAESDKLKELTEGFKWGILHEDLVAFVEAVKNM